MPAHERPFGVKDELAQLLWALLPQHLEPVAALGLGVLVDKDDGLAACHCRSDLAQAIAR